MYVTHLFQQTAKKTAFQQPSLRFKKSHSSLFAYASGRNVSIRASAWDAIVCGRRKAFVGLVSIRAISVNRDSNLFRLPT